VISPAAQAVDSCLGVPPAALANMMGMMKLLVAC
jgi:hypothetical protein